MEEDSSEEDFEFLSQYLEEHNGLPYGAMKLLRGCVQFEYKDRKYPGRFGRGQDGPAEEEEEEDLGEHISKIWTRKGATMRVQANRKGLSKEDIERMKGMSGEEQVSYMHDVFNFYAMDEKK